MWVPLYVTCGFSLLLLVFSFYLSFCHLMTACLDVFLFGFIMFETPFVSWAWMSVSFPGLGGFSYFIFTYFLGSFLSFLLLWPLKSRMLNAKDLLNCPHFISPFVLVFCSGPWFRCLQPLAHLVHSSVSFGQLLIPSRAGFTSLQDLRPDNPRWSKCNHNRIKGHDKCNVLNHTSFPSPWKHCLAQNRSWCQKGWGLLF